MPSSFNRTVHGEDRIPEVTASVSQDMRGIFGVETPATAADEPLRLIHQPGRIYRRAAGDRPSHPRLAIAVALLVGIAGGLVVSLWPSLVQRVEGPVPLTQQDRLTITDMPPTSRGGG